ncbi:hypothetical protein L484_023832 [Morus notabilis]|uniref:Glutathione S-transferase n=1 Tax=Morus notabilis TaxID=981085 RepID=W9R535_9ROSA|nr:hypothetical protein L484_023832 [Morus notabilis]
MGVKKLGLVDSVLGWLADLVSVFEEITGLKLIPEEKFPLLSTWMQVFADIPVIKESWPPRDTLFAKFRAIREAILSKDSQKDK